MKTLIQNGRVIDPASGLDEVADIAITAGKILAIIKKGESTPQGFQAEKTFDAKGYIVAPGLVDLQARLREPGYDHEGMLESPFTCLSSRCIDPRFARYGVNRDGGTHRSRMHWF